MRIVRFVVVLSSLLAAAAPAVRTVRAQGNPAPPANPITTSLRVYAGRYAGWLATAFDSIPASRYGFRPTPEQRSVGEIAAHLEEANYGLCERIGGMTRVTTAKDSLADSVKARWPKDTLSARFKASIDFCRRAFDGLNDAKLVDQVPYPPKAPTETTDRARYVVGFVADVADHWSQLAVYMRLMGMTPPSAYPRPKR